MLLLLLRTFFFIVWPCLQLCAILLSNILNRQPLKLKVFLFFFWIHIPDEDWNVHQHFHIYLLNPHHFPHENFHAHEIHACLAQCLIWHHKLHKKLLGFLSKSQITFNVLTSFLMLWWQVLLLDMSKKCKKKLVKLLLIRIYLFFFQIQTNPIIDGISHF